MPPRVTGMVLLALALAGSLRAQTTDSAAASPFRPLDLPTANDVRTGSGRPGKGYWQQRVDYRIEATLDPATHELRGRETIHYVNRSPDPLPYLWLFVEQNICAPGSVTNQLDQPPLVFLGSTFDFSCKGFAGGLTLDHVRLGLRNLATTVTGTTMRIDLPRPLAAGQFLDLDIGWHFTVPDYGAGRMGRDGTLYELGQWYPRMVVYDDVRGWNHEPYIGGGEFYLEYGRFDVALTVPADYIVGATGVLLNPAEVLTATQRARLARARSSSAPVAIITAEEAGQVGRRAAGRRADGQVAHARGASAPTAFATSPSAPPPTSAGMPAPIARRWCIRSTARRRRSGKRPTGWCATRCSTTASNGIRTPTRTSRASKGPSRVWSTR